MSLCLLVFLVLLVLLVLSVFFVRAKSFRKKNKDFKSALITSFILLLRLQRLFLDTPENNRCLLEKLWRLVMSVNHGIKSVQIRSFFWSVFSRIPTEYGDLSNTEFFLVRIQSEYRKILTRKNSFFGRFSGNGRYKIWQTSHQIGFRFLLLLILHYETAESYSC